jgi:hypothetical protein
VLKIVKLRTANKYPSKSDPIKIAAAKPSVKSNSGLGSAKAQFILKSRENELAVRIPVL